MRMSFFAVAATIAASVFASRGNAQTFKLLELQDPPGQPSRVVAERVSKDCRFVAGFAEFATGVIRDVVWRLEPQPGQAAVVVYVESQPLDAMVARGDGGVYVGQFDSSPWDASQANRPFTWHLDVLTMMSCLTTSDGVGGARDRNVAGSVVGYSVSASELELPVVWDTAAAAARVLPLPAGMNEGCAYGNNDANWIVGMACKKSDFAGTPVRNLTEPLSEQTAVLWVKENQRRLDTLLATNYGWSLLTANGVNDSGLIVGGGKDASGNARAYLLYPAMADINADGIIDGTDIDLFVGGLIDEDPKSDTYTDAELGSEDVAAFLAAYDAGNGGDPLPIYYSVCDLGKLLGTMAAASVAQPQPQSPCNVCSGATPELCSRF